MEKVFYFKLGIKCPQCFYLKSTECLDFILLICFSEDLLLFPLIEVVEPNLFLQLPSVFRN